MILPGNLDEREVRLASEDQVEPGATRGGVAHEVTPAGHDLAQQDARVIVVIAEHDIERTPDFTVRGGGLGTRRARG